VADRKIIDEVLHIAGRHTAAVADSQVIGSLRSVHDSEHAKDDQDHTHETEEEPKP